MHLYIELHSNTNKTYRVARYFKGQKFRGFCGFLLVLENKYPRKTEFCTITYVSKLVFLKYFKPMNRSTLPLPSEPLSEIVPSSSIEAANKEVKSTHRYYYYLWSTTTPIRLANSYSK